MGRRTRGGGEPAPGAGARPSGTPSLCHPDRGPAARASASGDRLALGESWALARALHCWEGDLVQGVWTACPTVGETAGPPPPL